MHDEESPSQALIFDAEGVVLDTEPLWDRAQAELLRKRGRGYDRDRIKPLLAGRAPEEGMAVLKGELGLSDDPAALAEERDALVRRAFSEEARFIPGFPDFFARVRADYPAALATAMDAGLLARVDRRLGLSALFTGHLYTAADAGGRGKPHPDLFFHAARRLGVAPERCLVLEDAPHGIEAARRAGMRCIGLATTFPPARLRAADHVVVDYDEIPPLLRPG
ncbi:MAG TPA: HAD family phosphatase [Gammaproteobacteria bacterium]|nr:HAD family phosphatase [Gammaproteobacteria bacterium]